MQSLYCVNAGRYWKTRRCWSTQSTRGERHPLQASSYFSEFLIIILTDEGRALIVRHDVVPKLVQMLSKSNHRDASSALIKWVKHRKSIFNLAFVSAYLWRGVYGVSTTALSPSAVTSSTDKQDTYWQMLLVGGTMHWARWEVSVKVTSESQAKSYGLRLCSYIILQWAISMDVP